MKKVIKVILLISILFATKGYIFASDPPGLMPVNRDGFETGDWRNFRPHYVGDSEDFIRPNFVINDTDPINGQFSLRWKSGDKDHKWLMLSNAFYLKKPVNISVDFRVKGETDNFAAGLVMMESLNSYAGVKVTGQGAAIHKEGDATIGKPIKEMAVKAGNVYRLSVSMADDYSMVTEVTEKNSGKVVSRIKTSTYIDPEALSMYIETGEDANTTIDFDDLEVNADDYRIPSGTYVRSPQFVMLPRLPDVKQDQGNWVGGQSTIVNDGEYLMWYRIRDNQERGRGYGFARSSDGLNWDKYEKGPLFTHDPDFSSNEKISVRKVDGLYRAWYTVNAPDSWYTAYATSEDGINWEKHGLVINETYCKDPVVIYLDGTYYLYSIKDNDKIGVYTSPDGVDFTHRNTIDVGIHRHVAAFYEKKSGLFHLYSTGGHNGVSHAVSSNGIDFGLFKNVWNPPAVGLDDWDRAGITYLSFPANQYGHLEDAESLPVYYQARNTWDNNIPGWHYHGGERIVLGGKFEGIYKGVPTIVQPDGKYHYESFPFRVPKAEGLTFAASRPVKVVVDRWNMKGDTTVSGHLETLSELPGRTMVQVKMENLVPGIRYKLLINGNNTTEAVADKYGKLLFNVTVERKEEGEFVILRE
ncbi:MAG: hypothetical protein V5A59_12380 [Bacteroidales bacterium]|nr:hypothetical protein [Bacteroidales bacterium]MBS3774608.1 hypothetical protein [Bacteroidales bacterium]